jgi:hypothetical protein
MGDKEKEQPQQQEYTTVVREQRTVAMEPYLPENLVAQFSNNFALVNTGTEIFLSFLQPEVPLITGSASSSIEQIPPIRNKCVARIILTPAGVQALAELLNKYRQQ